MPDQLDKAARFRALHEGRPFVIPNPWDVGSAGVLAALASPHVPPRAPGLPSPWAARTGARRFRVARARARARRGDRPASVSGLGERPRTHPGGRGCCDHRRRRGWSRRRLDRGLGPWRGTVSARARSRANRRCASGRRWSRFPFTLTARARITFARTRNCPTRSTACRPTSAPVPTCSSRQG